MQMPLRRSTSAAAAAAAAASQQQQQAVSFCARQCVCIWQRLLPGRRPQSPSCFSFFPEAAAVAAAAAGKGCSRTAERRAVPVDLAATASVSYTAAAARQSANPPVVVITPGEARCFASAIHGQGEAAAAAAPVAAAAGKAGGAAEEKGRAAATPRAASKRGARAAATAAAAGETAAAAGAVGGEAAAAGRTAGEKAAAAVAAAAIAAAAREAISAAIRRAAAAAVARVAAPVGTRRKLTLAAPARGERQLLSSSTFRSSQPSLYCDKWADGVPRSVRTCCSSSSRTSCEGDLPTNTASAVAEVTAEPRRQPSAARWPPAAGSSAVTVLAAAAAAAKVLLPDAGAAAGAAAAAAGAAPAAATPGATPAAGTAPAAGAPAVAGAAQAGASPAAAAAAARPSCAVPCAYFRRRPSNCYSYGNAYRSGGRRMEGSSSSGHCCSSRDMNSVTDIASLRTSSTVNNSSSSCSSRSHHSSRRSYSSSKSHSSVSESNSRSRHDGRLTGGSIEAGGHLESERSGSGRRREEELKCSRGREEAAAVAAAVQRLKAARLPRHQETAAWGLLRRLVAAPLPNIEACMQQALRGGEEHPQQQNLLLQQDERSHVWGLSGAEDNSSLLNSPLHQHLRRSGSIRKKSGSTHNGGVGTDASVSFSSSDSVGFSSSSNSSSASCSTSRNSASSSSSSSVSSSSSSSVFSSRFRSSSSRGKGSFFGNAVEGAANHPLSTHHAGKTDVVTACAVAAVLRGRRDGVCSHLLPANSFFWKTFLEQVDLDVLLPVSHILFSSPSSLVPGDVFDALAAADAGPALAAAAAVPSLAAAPPLAASAVFLSTPSAAVASESRAAASAAASAAALCPFLPFSFPAYSDAAAPTMDAVCFPALATPERAVSPIPSSSFPSSFSSSSSAQPPAAAAVDDSRTNRWCFLPRTAAAAAAKAEEVPAAAAAWNFLLPGSESGCTAALCRAAVAVGIFAVLSRRRRRLLYMSALASPSCAAEEAAAAAEAGLQAAAGAGRRGRRGGVAAAAASVAAAGATGGRRETAAPLASRGGEGRNSTLTRSQQLRWRRAEYDREVQLRMLLQQQLLQVAHAVPTVAEAAERAAVLLLRSGAQLLQTSSSRVHLQQPLLNQRQHQEKEEGRSWPAPQEEEEQQQQQLQRPLTRLPHKQQQRKTCPQQEQQKQLQQQALQERLRMQAAEAYEVVELTRMLSLLAKWVGRGGNGPNPSSGGAASAAAAAAATAAAPRKRSTGRRGTGEELGRGWSALGAEEEGGGGEAATARTSVVPPRIMTGAVQQQLVQHPGHVSPRGAAAAAAAAALSAKELHQLLPAALFAAVAASLYHEQQVSANAALAAALLLQQRLLQEKPAAVSPRGPRLHSSSSSLTSGNVSCSRSPAKGNRDVLNGGRSQDLCASSAEEELSAVAAHVGACETAAGAVARAAAGFHGAVDETPPAEDEAAMEGDAAQAAARDGVAEEAAARAVAGGHRASAAAPGTGQTMVAAGMAKSRMAVEAAAAAAQLKRKVIDALAATRRNLNGTAAAETLAVAVGQTEALLRFLLHSHDDADATRVLLQPLLLPPYRHIQQQQQQQQHQQQQEPYSTGLSLQVRPMPTRSSSPVLQQQQHRQRRQEMQQHKQQRECLQHPQNDCTSLKEQQQGQEHAQILLQKQQQQQHEEWLLWERWIEDGYDAAAAAADAGIEREDVGSQKVGGAVRGKKSSNSRPQKAWSSSSSMFNPLQLDSSPLSDSTPYFPSSLPGAAAAALLLSCTRAPGVTVLSAAASAAVSNQSFNVGAVSAVADDAAVAAAADGAGAAADVEAAERAAGDGAARTEAVMWEDATAATAREASASAGAAATGAAAEARKAEKGGAVEEAETLETAAVNVTDNITTLHRLLERQEAYGWPQEREAAAAARATAGNTASSAGAARMSAAIPSAATYQAAAAAGEAGGGPAIGISLLCWAATSLARQEKEQQLRLLRLEGDSVYDRILFEEANHSSAFESHSSSGDMRNSCRRTKRSSSSERWDVARVGSSQSMSHMPIGQAALSGGLSMVQQQLQQRWVEDSSGRREVKGEKDSLLLLREAAEGVAVDKKRHAEQLLHLMERLEQQVLPPPLLRLPQPPCCGAEENSSSSCNSSSTREGSFAVEGQQAEWQVLGPRHVVFTSSRWLHPTTTTTAPATAASLVPAAAAAVGAAAATTGEIGGGSAVGGVQGRGESLGRPAQQQQLLQDCQQQSSCFSTQQHEQQQQLSSSLSQQQEGEEEQQQRQSVLSLQQPTQQQLRINGRNSIPASHLLTLQPHGGEALHHQQQLSSISLLLQQQQQEEVSTNLNQQVCSSRKVCGMGEPWHKAKEQQQQQLTQQRVVGCLSPPRQQQQHHVTIADGFLGAVQLAEAERLAKKALHRLLLQLQWRSAELPFNASSSKSDANTDCRKRSSEEGDSSCSSGSNHSISSNASDDSNSNNSSDNHSSGDRMSGKGSGNSTSTITSLNSSSSSWAPSRSSSSWNTSSSETLGRQGSGVGSEGECVLQSSEVRQQQQQRAEEGQQQEGQQRQEGPVLLVQQLANMLQAWENLPPLVATSVTVKTPRIDNSSRRMHDTSSKQCAVLISRSSSDSSSSRGQSTQEEGRWVSAASSRQAASAEYALSQERFPWSAAAGTPANHLSQGSHSSISSGRAGAEGKKGSSCIISPLEWVSGRNPGSEGYPQRLQRRSMDQHQVVAAVVQKLYFCQQQQQQVSRPQQAQQQPQLQRAHAAASCTGHRAAFPWGKREDVPSTVEREKIAFFSKDAFFAPYSVESRRCSISRNSLHALQQLLQQMLLVMEKLVYSLEHQSLTEGKVLPQVVVATKTAVLVEHLQALLRSAVSPFSAAVPAAAIRQTCDARASPSHGSTAAAALPACSVNSRASHLIATRSAAGGAAAAAVPAAASPPVADAHVLPGREVMQRALPPEGEKKRQQQQQQQQLTMRSRDCRNSSQAASSQGCSPAAAAAVAAECPLLQNATREKGRSLLLLQQQQTQALLQHVQPQEELEHQQRIQLLPQQCRQRDTSVAAIIDKHTKGHDHGKTLAACCVAADDDRSKEAAAETDERGFCAAEKEIEELGAAATLQSSNNTSSRGLFVSFSSCTTSRFAALLLKKADDSCSEPGSRRRHTKEECKEGKLCSASSPFSMGSVACFPRRDVAAAAAAASSRGTAADGVAFFLPPRPSHAAAGVAAAAGAASRGAAARARRSGGKQKQRAAGSAALLPGYLLPTAGGFALLQPRLTTYSQYQLETKKKQHDPLLASYAGSAAAGASLYINRQLLLRATAERRDNSGSDGLFWLKRLNRLHNLLRLLATTGAASATQ